MRRKFSIDFSQPAGVIRRLNGTNLGPEIATQTIWERNEMFRELRFSTVRLHDVPLENVGMRLVDYNQIFGNMYADATEPRNYDFRATDDYIGNIRNLGSEVIYRLGTSIEHSRNHYFAVEPDHEKFAAVCCGIVRHYNAGWAGGFHWNLPYWEIWNEPDLQPQMWNSDLAAYRKMYVTVARALRAEFPEIKIGGPAFTWPNPEEIKLLLEECRACGAPLDFFTYHTYTSSIEEMLSAPCRMRALLDEYGFTSTEIHLNEWHYLPCSWMALRGTPEEINYWMNSDGGAHGSDSAAFSTLLLSRWQDTPMTMTNFYATGLKNWGFLDPTGKKRKTWFAFRAFGQLASLCPERVAAEALDEHCALLAGTGENGRKMALLSDFRGMEFELEIALKGVPENGIVEVWKLDAVRDELSFIQEYSEGILKLPKDTGSAIFLLNFRD